MREAIVGKWPKQGVGFDVERGSFDVSAEMLRHAAETGDDFEIRRAFAVHIPDEANVSRREKYRGGLRIHWRIVRVVSLAPDGDAVDGDPFAFELDGEARREIGIALHPPIGFFAGEG